MIIQAGMRICNALDPPIDAKTNDIILGTIGGWVLGPDGTPHILTCFHCVKARNDSYNHFDPKGKNNRVKTRINGAFVDFGTIINAMLNKDVDAALVKVDPGFEQINEIPGMNTCTGHRVIGEKAEPIILSKYSELSDYQTGTLKGISSGTGCEYGAPVGYHRFNRLYSVKGDDLIFATLGDSGSLIFDQGMKAVGMLVLIDKSSGLPYIIPADHLVRNLSINFKI